MSEEGVKQIVSRIKLDKMFKNAFITDPYLMLLNSDYDLNDKEIKTLSLTDIRDIVEPVTFFGDRNNFRAEIVKCA